MKTINNIKIINHKYTTHIPGATLDGLIFAKHENYDYAITMDAGLSHDPNEIPLFMNFEHCDLLIGVRQRFVYKPIYRHFLTKVGNLVYNISLNFPFSILKFNMIELRLHKASLSGLINSILLKKSSYRPDIK